MFAQTPPQATDILVDEIRRQLQVLSREKWPRIVLTTLAFALSTVFLPLWVAALAAAVDIAGEITGMRLMQGLDPKRDVSRYRLSIVSIFVMEASYAFTAGLVWLQPDLHAQAFALGMIMITLIHLSTVRAIHLPFGIAGFAAVALAILISNTLYWMMMTDWNGLVISSLCALGGLGYALTAMMSNNDLHKASARSEAAAQAADSEKSRFLARMSHELRTPLNAIIGFGIAERDRARDATSQERLGTLVESAKGLATILDDILDLSAIGAGRFPLRERDFNLRAEVATICAIFADQFRAKGIFFSSEVAEDLPGWIRLDPQRLRQCVTNLVSNALRHSGADQVTLSVTQGPASEGALPLLRILVRDNGCGISQSTAARLFEPFRQGLEAQDGTGLGLAICRAMARQMGGDVVSLSVAHGSAFQLDLAFAVAMAPKNGTSASLMPNLAGRTILIVDDIPTNRLVAATVLLTSYARTIEAEGGEAALQVLDEARVDLVLLDMNMPRMDGLETFRRMRDKSAHLSLPIVAMTADAADDHRRHYLALGLDDHLAKPIDPEALAQVMRRHLVSRTAESDMPQGAPVMDASPPHGSASGRA